MKIFFKFVSAVLALVLLSGAAPLFATKSSSATGSTMPACEHCAKMHARKAGTAMFFTSTAPCCNLHSSKTVPSPIRQAPSSSLQAGTAQPVVVARVALPSVAPVRFDNYSPDKLVKHQEPQARLCTFLI